MSALGKFLALSSTDRLLLLEAWFYLAAARLALLIVPFGRIAPHLGRQILPGPAAETTAPPPTARRVAWSVETMSRHTPWESACLAQSIAAKYMLRRRGLPSWLFLGTKKDDRGNLAAHAWLQSGNEIVLGGGDSENFTMLSGFGEPSP